MRFLLLVSCYLMPDDGGPLVLMWLPGLQAQQELVLELSTLRKKYSPQYDI